MKLLTLNKIQTRKQFVDRLLQQGIIQDGETLQNMSSEDLALLVQNAWSPEARAAAARAHMRKANKVAKSHSFKLMSLLPLKNEDFHLMIFRKQAANIPKGSKETHHELHVVVSHEGVSHWKHTVPGRPDGAFNPNLKGAAARRISTTTVAGTGKGHSSLVSHLRKEKLTGNTWSPEARAAAARGHTHTGGKRVIDPNKDALSLWAQRSRLEIRNKTSSIQYGLKSSKLPQAGLAPNKKPRPKKKITGNTLHDQNGEHGCADCGSTIPWDKTFCPECSLRFATNLLRNIWSPEARAKAIAARHKRAGLSKAHRSIVAKQIKAFRKGPMASVGRKRNHEGQKIMLQGFKKKAQEAQSQGKQLRIVPSPPPRPKATGLVGGGSRFTPGGRTGRFSNSTYPKGRFF